MNASCTKCKPIYTCLTDEYLRPATEYHRWTLSSSTKCDGKRVRVLEWVVDPFHGRACKNDNAGKTCDRPPDKIRAGRGQRKILCRPHCRVVSGGRDALCDRRHSPSGHLQALDELFDLPYFYVAVGSGLLAVGGHFAERKARKLLWTAVGKARTGTEKKKESTDARSRTHAEQYAIAIWPTWCEKLAIL